MAGMQKCLNTFCLQQLSVDLLCDIQQKFVMQK